MGYFGWVGHYFGWVSVYGALFWVGGGEWGWVEHYFGRVGVGRGAWWWVGGGALIDNAHLELFFDGQQDNLGICS